MKDALVGNEATLFYFFEYDNVELLVKVLDGCAVNGRYWVFGSAATDLEYQVGVIDRAGGSRRKIYVRNSGNNDNDWRHDFEEYSVENGPQIIDTDTFECFPSDSAALSGASSGSPREKASVLSVDNADMGGDMIELPAVSADETDADDLPLCGGAIAPNVPEDLSLAAALGPRPAEGVTPKLASQDRIHVIDIAFIYAGSIDRGKLLRTADAVVLKANVIFQRSGVNARLRTVAVQPDHRYGLSLNGKGPSEAIRTVRSVLTEVRADNGADLAYAITDETDPEACGWANQRTRGEDGVDAAGYAVGSIWNGCFTNSMVLAHEVGHNLGLDHNIENTTLEPFMPFGRGWNGHNVDNRFYNTVMSVRGGNRFSRFSTDSVHDGLRMGSDSADASRALLYTIEDASNYSPTKIEDPVPAYECSESSTAVCLHRGRFRVEAGVSYLDSTTGERVDTTAKVKNAMLNGTVSTTSLFWFFSESNPELLVKVLDGCGVNGRYWVFGSAATDLDYQVVVTDNATGVTLPYHRNASDPLINDSEAFPCQP